jgi:hypothetical protein
VTVKVTQGMGRAPASTSSRRYAGLTAPALTAAIVAGLSFVLFVALGFARVAAATGLLGVILRHAFEGAVVGATCDFIAVQGVYKKARERFPELVRGVSETVVRDMVALRSLVGVSDPAGLEHRWRETVRPRAIDALVQWDLRGHLVPDPPGDPPGQPRVWFAAASVAARCLEHAARDTQLATALRAALIELANNTYLTDLGLPSETVALRTILRRVWLGAPRETIVDWVQSLDLRGRIDTGVNGALLSDHDVRVVAAECIRKANKNTRVLQEVRDRILEQMPTTGVTGLFLSEKKIKAKFDGLSDAIKFGGEPSPLVKALVAYAREYLKAWHDLERRDRARAVMRLVDVSAPAILDELALTLAPRLAHLRLSKIVDPVMTLDVIQGQLLRAAQLLRELTGDRKRSNSGLAAASLGYLVSYLDAWHALPEDMRRRAAEELVDALAPSILKAVSAFGRDGFDPVALETTAVDLLDRALTSRGVDEIVGALQERTQEHLDKIKVNGTLVGMLLGVVAGVIGELLAHV